MKALVDLQDYRGKTLHLYGGTLDPIHRGHIEVARAAVREMGWNELVLMVAGTPPHKRNRQITSAHHRLEMARLAAEPYPEIRICAWEAQRREYAYTAETLRQLRQEFCIADIDFMIGADSLMQIERWYQPESILQSAHIVSVGRPDQVGSADMERQAGHLREKYGARITLLEMQGPDISATALRENLLHGKDVGEDVPEAVLDYIRREGLYRGESDE